MVKSLIGNRNALPVRVEQPDLATARDDLPDAPKREVEFGGKGGDLGAFFGRGGKNKLVVVATGQLALACQLRVGASGQTRELTEQDFRVNLRTLGDMTEIGEQAV